MQRLKPDSNQAPLDFVDALHHTRTRAFKPEPKHAETSNHSMEDSTDVPEFQPKLSVCWKSNRGWGVGSVPEPDGRGHAAQSAEPPDGGAVSHAPPVGKGGSVVRWSVCSQAGANTHKGAEEARLSRAD